MARKSNRLSVWVTEIQRSIEQRVDAALASPGSELLSFRQHFARSTGHDISEPEFRNTCCDALAWAIIYSTIYCKGGIEAVLDRARAYTPFVAGLLSVLPPKYVSKLARNPARQLDVDGTLHPLLLYEQHLATRDPSQRLQRGVFYTPRGIAKHIVESVDFTLREQFGLAAGLADTATWNQMRRRLATLDVPDGMTGDEPFVRVLDPAAGTGVFLVEVVDRIHRTMLDAWREQGLNNAKIVTRWNDYVSRHLLPRLMAIELMPTPCVISQIMLADKLAETGYDFRANETFRFSIADTLLSRADVEDIATSDNLANHTTTVLHDTLSRVAFTVVLGNPPFRGISSNSSRWMNQLLRGTGPTGRSLASYYEIDGEPLRERKHWLQDDYVKFMRYAQWQIERAGAGVVGFVTNHGYLDNATFRAMRHGMLETFQRIDVLDLHGNRKKNKAAPGGGIDEGMFEIEQGVAIGLFARTAANDTRVTHREVWGTRQAKAAALSVAERVPKTRLEPRAPHFLFVPSTAELHPEYEAGFALNDIMPVYSTAVVTARDSFVVGFDEDSLAQRMRDFCDASVPDAEIRSSYFTNSRSTKYPPGDTRGWKLADARKRLMNEASWAAFLRPCLYRPFDRRVVFWADWMIDWPRLDVMRHMLARPNLALVARRQMPPTGPCNYFWITDTLALDGLIRSDNRGSESIFPLWLDSDSAPPQANLTQRFVSEIASRLSLCWEPDGEVTGEERFGPTEVLHYIYGLFNAPTYRQRYSESLRRDFPRVLVPTSRLVWQTFRDIGRQLAKLHLLKTPSQAKGLAVRSPNAAEQPISLRGGFPKFESGQIWLGTRGPSVPASERVWNYHVGTHQVCRKWLRDRKTIDASTLLRYQQILAAIAETLELTDRLDSVVAESGGWEAVFAT